MAVSNTPVFVQTPRLGSVVLSTTSGVGAATVMSAGSNGTKVVSLCAASNSSVSQLAFVLLSSGGGTIPIMGSAIVSANAGIDGSTANSDLFSGGASSLITGLPTDNDGQKYLYLPNGYSLQVSLAATLPAGKSFYVFSVGGDF